MPRKRKDDTHFIYVLLIALAILAIFLRNAPRTQTTIAEAPEFPEFPQQPEIRRIYHVHVDFAVFINDQAVDFNRPEFDFVNRAIHLHILNFMGDRVIHIESESADMGDFFASLGMVFNETCFAVDEEYCNNSTHALRFYVNGVQNNEYENYRPNDLDRMLISYGNEDVSEQIDSVTSFACIFSQKCAPPPEAENRIIYN